MQTTRRSRLASALLAAGLVFTLPASAQAPAPTLVTGTDIALSPPDGFLPATSFQGFQNVQALATIEIGEIRLAIDDLLAQVSADAYRAEGWTLARQTPVQLGEREGALIYLQANNPDDIFHRIQLLLGDALASIRVTAAYPAAAEEALLPQLRHALLTTEWRRSAEQQFLSGLPFSVDQAGALKFAKRTHNMLVLSTEGASGISLTSPAVVIGHLHSKQELTDHKGLSHAHLDRLSSIRVTQIVDEQPTQLAGIAAYRITANAVDAASGQRLLFDQILVFQPHKYLLVQSTVPESLRDEYRAQFDQVIASISFNRKS